MQRALVSFLVLLAAAAALAFWWLGGATVRSQPGVSRADESNVGSADRSSAPHVPADVEPPITAAPGPENSGAERRGVESSDRGRWLLRGRVRVLPDQPFPGARLRIERVVGGLDDAEPVEILELRADAAGRFQCGFDPPTDRTVLRCLEDEPEHFAFLRSIVVHPGDEPPQDLVVDLYAYDLVVRGQVLAEPDGIPVDGAWVELHGARHACDEQGRFELRATRGLSELYLTAGAPGHVATREVLGSPESDMLEVELRLVAGRRLTGRVVDESARPVEGARVETFFRRGTDLLTGPDGRFVFDDLDLDREVHQVRASAAGYVAAQARVELAEWPEDLELVLTRGARVHGFVRDAGGAPIGYADLFLGFDPHAWNRLDARADAAGRYEFAAVAAGRQLLWIEAEGFAPGQERFEIAAARRDLQVDVQLERGRAVGGIVVDARGEPVEDAYLSAKRNTGLALSGASWDYIDRSTRTDAQGRFSLAALPVEPLQLEVYGRGILRADHELDLETSDVRIVVSRAAKIAGQVVDDATGEPVTAFRIRIVEGGGGYGASWAREGHSFRSAEGLWDTDSENLEPGSTWGVQAWAEGYAPARLSGLAAELAPDPRAHVIRLTRGGTVTGRVVQESDGQPIGDAQVLMFEDARTLSRFRHDPFGAVEDRTGADGAFALEHVPSGSVRLAVLLPGERPAVIDGPFELPELGRVERTILIGSGASVHGRVIGLDGATLVTAEVSLSQLGVDATAGRPDTRRGSTDGDGRFRFEHLATGRYLVQAHVPDPGGWSFSAARFVEVGKGEEHVLDLRPAGEATIRGTVDATPPVADGTRVMLRLLADGGDTPTLQGRVLAGRFEVRGLAAGRYAVTVVEVNRGVRTGSAEVRVADGGEAEVALTVKAPGR